MSDSNLFSRLADYSRNPRKRSLENFTTELLAHFFNTDLKFRRRFANLLFEDRRMARPFVRKDVEATTQERLGKDCCVDLVLWSGSKAHLVEVKIAARETASARWGQTGKPQVQRYLDLRQGNVTFLTTREALEPEVDGRGRRRFRLVRHALFEELYVALRDLELPALTEAFVQFMKNNGLSGPEPFGRSELKQADKAMEVVQKCKDTLALVRTEVNTAFRKNLRTYSNLTRPSHQAFDDGGGEVYCYLPKFKRRVVRSVGLTLITDDHGILFCVWARGILDPSLSKMRDYLDWDWWDGNHGLISPGVRLHGNRNDLSRMIDHARVASRQLGRALKKFN